VLSSLSLQARLFTSANTPLYSLGSEVSLMNSVKPEPTHVTPPTPTRLNCRVASRRRRRYVLSEPYFSKTSNSNEYNGVYRYMVCQVQRYDHALKQHCDFASYEKNEQVQQADLFKRQKVMFNIVLQYYLSYSFLKHLPYLSSQLARENQLLRSLHRSSKQHNSWDDPRIM